MGTCVTPPHEVCREYAIDHFRSRQSAYLSKIIANELPWDQGTFEIVMPRDAVPPSIAAWNELKSSLAKTKAEFGAWMYPVDRLGRRLRDLIGRAGYWLAFDDGVSEPKDIVELHMETHLKPVMSEDGMLGVADASIPDEVLEPLIHDLGPAWGICLMIGRNPAPTRFDERVIREEVRMLVIIAHDGDAFLLWHRAS